MAAQTGKTATRPFTQCLRTDRAPKVVLRHRTLSRRTPDAHRAAHGSRVAHDRCLLVRELGGKRWDRQYDPGATGTAPSGGAVVKRSSLGWEESLTPCAAPMPESSAFASQSNRLAF